MSESPERMILPIVPLAPDSVLLPAVNLRIPVQGRPDIPAILSAVYARGAQSPPDGSAAWIGCVPLCLPLLSHEGQKLLEDSEIRMRKTAEHIVADPGDGEPKDLFGYGVMAKIAGVQGRRRGELALVVQGVKRFRVERFTQFKPYLECEATCLEDDGTTQLRFGSSANLTVVIDVGDTAGQRLFQETKELSKELLVLLRLSTLLPRSASSLSPTLLRRLELFVIKKELQEAGILADFMTNIIDSTFEEKLQILAALDIKKRLETVNEVLSRHIQSIKGNVKVATITSTSLPPQGLDITDISQQQRDALMRRVVGGFGPGQLPPGMARGPSDSDGDQEPSELDELKQKLDDAKLTLEAQRVADKELKRLRKMNPAQAEYGVCRTYLENLSEIPWSNFTEDQLGVETLKRARQQLDDDHYGLEKIKKRLLEYLAVLKLKQTKNAEIDAEIQRANEEAVSRESSKSQPSDPETETHLAKIEVLKRKRFIDKSPILLLVGPPGTGKTSLAQSVAHALGRKFHRISLGGVRDEAEIRGHRRTYVAAMPGLIVSGLKKVGVANPVFLLDEIDKVGGTSFHGDPSAAMLEVLDPEQNHSFTDHYVNIPIDLSKVLFIATANSLDTIPAPLLDRMETINLSGYTTVEKRHIATQHLIPKQITTNGLAEGSVIFEGGVIDTIITAYTRESGVRNLEREIGSVCRFKAVEYSDAKDNTESSYDPSVTVSALETILGSERFDEEIADKEAVPGVVTGLVAYSFGGQGSILFIEVADMPGSGRVQLTGTLGDVLKESVEVALTWVKAHAFELCLTNDETEDIMKNRSIHVHCPSGAVPKDGPSAGLAHTIALISLFSGRTVPPTMAMTGEVSLRGRVLPVGGIKEKLIGALRAGVKTVLLPKTNLRDVKDLPDEVKTGLDIKHVSGIWDAVRLVWPGETWREPGLVVESRL